MAMSNPDADRKGAVFWAVLMVLALVYSHVLATVTDDEFHDPYGPLASVDRAQLVRVLCVRRFAQQCRWTLTAGLTGGPPIAPVRTLSACGGM